MKVSVIVPIRNEEVHIRECLDSILSQDYPRECMEILVIDGMSDDNTRGIIQDEYLTKFSNVSLLDNPKKTAPTAMNIGIRRSSGDIIIRMDGHSYMDRDFVKNAVDILNKKPYIDCVGGPIESINEDYKSQAISLAMSSPFGVGNAKFRYSKEEQLVDTLAFGAYRREVFERIGLFDEELVRNQDDELNFRLVKSGGKILLSPFIRSFYYTRSSFGKLWKQYYQYGFWKVKVIKKHHQVPSLRSLIPMAFVMGLLVSAFISFFYTPFRWLLFLICISYGMGNIISASIICTREGWKYFFMLIFAFFILHFSYGLGFLDGLWRFCVMQGRGMQSDKHNGLTR